MLRFQYHFFLHKQLWDQLKNQINYSLVLRAANNGSNSILTILQILHSSHARQNRPCLLRCEVVHNDI